MKRWRRRGLALALLLVLLAAGIPTLLLLPWRWIPPPTSAFMLRSAAEGLEVEQKWVAWQEISPQLALAVVAAEDQRFPLHRGFDVESIRSALDEERGRRRGASTISQQVVKNLFLWPERSWLRKGIEAHLTLFVEMLWPKRRILEVYLNLAEFGPGVYGAEAASQRYFGKQAADLSQRQAALLAAVLPNPRRYSATAPSGYVRKRAEWIERQMRQLGGSSYLAGL